MYKVFFNENLVVFTEENTILQGFHTEKFTTLDLQFFIDELYLSHGAKIQVICENLANDWSRFTQKFQVRSAAGGVVKNEENEILWIRRFDKWDLPKGHIEKGETKQVSATREVEEECNVFGLEIDEELETTYHVFKHKGIDVLKISYWFLMRVQGKQELVPQLEEGITEVCFKNRVESLNCLSNTYGNIKLLLKDVLN